MPIPNNTRKMLPNIVKPIKTISRKIISRKPKNPKHSNFFFLYTTYNKRATFIVYALFLVKRDRMIYHRMIAAKLLILKKNQQGDAYNEENIADFVLFPGKTLEF